MFFSSKLSCVPRSSNRLKIICNLLSKGLKAWESGIQLFEQVFANREKIFKGKRILELGSGCGLAGVLISALCELESYTFTDHHPKVLSLIKENLEINGFSLTKGPDKKLNKFYEFEDEDGNKSAKYYETDTDEPAEPFGSSFKTSSFNGFGSFVRQGPMDLKQLTKKKNEFDFDDKFTKFSLNDDIFSSSDGFKDPGAYGFGGGDSVCTDLSLAGESAAADKGIKEKIKQFDKQLDNFEQMLLDFEKKLCVVESESKSQRARPVASRKGNSKNRNRNVNVSELDWFSSANEIVSQLERVRPDYVIASDIVYDPKIIPDLIRVFRLCLSTLDCGIIVVCSIRNEETIKEFEQRLRRLQKEEQGVTIQRNKLSAKLTYFENLELSGKKFVLYNIRNDGEDEEE